MKKSLLLFISMIAIGLFSQVSAQLSYTFTNAGATGQNGPTQGQINTAYAGTSLAGAVTINTQGVQEWVVPASGIYFIEAKGAQGGHSVYNGGLGSVMSGEFALNAGQVLKVVVGQQGGVESGNINRSGGGGGGSFVYTGATLYIAAGGGAGKTGYTSGTYNFPTADANSTTNGNAGSGWSQGSGGAGGVSGNGGSGSSWGAGGAGWLSNGIGATNYVESMHGKSASSNWIGGTPPSGGGLGGFGGGAAGGVAYGGGGGGGGYSGGGAGDDPGSGGGAGSFNSGNNQINVAGVNTGHGQVVITPLTSPAPNNAGVVFFVSPTFVNNTVCSGMATVEAAIQNFGSNQITSLDVEWTFDGIAQPTFNYTSLLDTFGGAAGAIDTVTLGTINITGNAQVVAWTSMPNGVMDTINLNDTASISIDSVITIQLDLGPDKVSCDGNFLILENIGSNQVFNTYSWSTGASSSTIITNQAGTYSLSVTYGPPQCFAADQIVVTTAPLPNVDLGPDSTYCANEFVLDAGGDGSVYVWSDGSSSQTNTVTNSGNYSVTVTSEDGCINEDDINLTLLETPVVDLGEDFKLCISYDQTQLLSAGNSFSSYLWSTGATTPNIVVGAGVTAVGNQTYSVTVTGDNGCTGEDAVVVEYSMCLGVNEKANTVNVSHFPNPATDLVTFLSEGTNITEVQIFDLTGKMIYNNLPASNRLDVNTTEFASGTYIVKVLTNSESVTRRLIVE
jgi:hypothetical protein